MTLLGKIFVVLIMALSLAFLGVTTVVFSTATNWKDAYEKQKDTITKRDRDLAARKVTEDSLTKRLDDLTREFAAAAATSTTKISDLSAEIKKAQDTITDAQKALTDARANAELATTEASARVTDLTKTRDTLTEALAINAKMKATETELNTKIMILERSLAASERSEKSLREISLKVRYIANQRGINVSDLTGVPAVEIPPEVEGKVLKVDAKNQTVEISIGSDDGLAVGQELFLFRSAPVGVFLGKVRISATDPDQAVARVIGKTVNGLKIKEGDDVATTIRSK